jgi:hypothetical protein
VTRTAPFFLLLASCGGVTLDAGSDHPHGRLPVDERNPVIVSNDGARDNWHGEFAMALASSGHLKLAGIIVNASRNYPSLESNVQDWRDMVKAAKGSGMSGIPDPTASVSVPLKRPGDGNIDSTEPNRSEGARLIMKTAHQLSQPLRPIVVATGGRLTDIADAYLMDATVADQVVVVASLGEPSGDGATMGPPNGELDPWADEIVVRKFRYVQVNAYYPQKDDIPPARIGELPANSFGAWMSSKLGDILFWEGAADQGSVIAAALPSFATDIQRVSESGAGPPSDGQMPPLGRDERGRAWLVTRGDNAGATARFWQALKDPATFAH